jgi:hypothetical protein
MTYLLAIRHMENTLAQEKDAAKRQHMRTLIRQTIREMEEIKR